MKDACLHVVPSCMILSERRSDPRFEGKWGPWKKEIVVTWVDDEKEGEGLLSLDHKKVEFIDVQ